MADLLYAAHWTLSPLPELLSLGAVAGGIAFLMRAGTLRSTKFTRPSVNTLSIIVAVFVLMALVVGWTAGILAPEPPSTPFDEQEWAARRLTRVQMATDIIDRRLLYGKTQSQVNALLSDSDGSYDLCDESWMLYRPRDAFVPFPPELAVDYDSAGAVERVYIVPGLFGN